MLRRYAHDGDAYFAAAAAMIIFFHADYGALSLLSHADIAAMPYSATFRRHAASFMPR